MQTAQLTEDEIYLVTNRVEEDMRYIHNLRNGWHQFSRQMGSVPFMKQIFVRAEDGALDLGKSDGKTPRKVKITGEYLVGALSESDGSRDPEEYKRLLKIWEGSFR